MKKLSSSAALLMTQVSGCLILMAASHNAAAPFAGPTNSIPEPGPMGLLALGTVALLLVRRVNRNK